MTVRKTNSFVSHKKQRSHFLVVFVVSLFLLVFLAVPSFAAHYEGSVSTDKWIIGQNNSIWGSLFSESSHLPYSPHNATVSIYAPNTSILVDSVIFPEFETGQFYYTYIPEVRGNYYIVVEYLNTTSTLDSVGVSVYSQYEPISEETMIPLVILLGLITFGAYLLYVSKDMLNKPQGTIDKGIYKWLNPRNIGAFFHILAAWLVTTISYFLLLMSEGTAYAGLMETLFTAIIWMTAAYTFIYVTLYMVFLSISAYNEKLIKNN